MQVKTNKALVRELLGIALVIALVTIFRGHFPRTLSLGDALLDAAAILLAQGLARDLSRVYAARRASAAEAGTNGQKRSVTCFCVESTVGLTSILVGLALTFGWAPIPVHAPAIAWPSGIGAVLFFGTGVRNAVFDWRQRSVRLEPNHDARVIWGSAK